MSEHQKCLIPQEDFSDIINSGFVDIVSDDTMIGHKIIVISACNLPNYSEIDHGKLQRYMTHILDKHVNRDYVLVYFHYGLTSKNMPSIKWLWDASSEFDRKYKKNLKTLYLVHPTGSIKFMWQCIKLLVSKKFKRKIVYIKSLQELKQYLNLDQIFIPVPVLNHDRQLLAQSNKRNCASLSSTLLRTQQFGVSLRFLKANNNTQMIPPLVRECVEHLERPAALSAIQLFGKSTFANCVSQDLKNRINHGEPIAISGDDAHLWAALLLTFLRELEEPLMTYELFDQIRRFKLTPKDKHLEQAKMLIVELLPLYNYYLLKYLIQFILKVADNCERNRMTTANLAYVFGSVLVRRPDGRLSICDFSQITYFIDFIIVNYIQIFYL